MSSRFNLLAAIPKTLLPKRVTSIQLIEGGLNNENLLINDSLLLKKYIAWDEFNDPVVMRFRREKESLQLFRGISFVPQLLNSYDKAPEFYISRQWVAGKPILLDQIRSNPELLMNALVRIHRESDSLKGDYNYFEVIKRYLGEYKAKISQFISHSFIKKESSILPRYKRVDTYFQELITKIQKINNSELKSRIHGDLVFSNILLTSDQTNIVFIDWEYSTLADPLIDLAYLFTQNQIPLQIQKILLGVYEKKQKFPVDTGLLELYCELMNLMSALWYFIHASRSIDDISFKSQKQKFWKFLKLTTENFEVIKLLE